MKSNAVANLDRSLRDIDRHASIEDQLRTLAVVRALLDRRITSRQVAEVCKRGSAAARKFADSLVIEFDFHDSAAGNPQIHSN